jgi:hypothetical protein
LNGVKFNKFGRAINQVAWPPQKPEAIVNPFQFKLEEFYGSIFNSRHFNSNTRNIRTGATLSQGHHGYEGKAKTRAMFVAPNPEYV